MSVISIVLKPGSRRGPVRRSDGTYSYYEVYIVRTNSSRDNGQVVENASGLPKIGRAYSGDASALVTELDPQQSDDSEFVWEVNVVYNRAAEDEDEDGDTESKVGQEPRRSWTSILLRTFPSLTGSDLDDKKFVNTAGEPIDPPPEMFKHHGVLNLQENRAEFNATQADKYRNAINSDSIVVDGKTYPPFSGRLNRYDGQREQASDGPYWSVTIEIEFNDDLWHPHKELSQGFRHLRAHVDELVLPRDDDDVLTGRLVLLNQGGFKLSKTSAPFFIPFRLYKQLPFSTLNLPLQ